MIWRVLEVTENDAEASGCTTALLLAEESVGSRQFHTTWNSGGDNDWNTSDIKAWLNNEICTKNSNDYTSNGFMSRFSDDEKGSIVTANYTYGGNYTGSGTTGSSKVFLLSVNEASKSDYFAGDADRAIGDYWWLRSPGNYRPNAAGVNDDGYVLANGYYVDIYSVAVRPALKINLASDIFTSKNPLVQAEITVTSSDSPVEDASISFSGASAPDGAILSGGEGKATAYLERDESYTMTVSKTGYEPYTATIEITQADQAIPVNLTLSDAIRPTVESITRQTARRMLTSAESLRLHLVNP